jgi:hypothetical protein
MFYIEGFFGHKLFWKLKWLHKFFCTVEIINLNSETIKGITSLYIFCVEIKNKNSFVMIVLF